VTWFKVDDGFYSSKKVMSIPRQQRLAAVGLWTMAGNWSGRELSDGVVPAYVLAELGATPKLCQALITARLWLDRGSGDVEFHDWARYQPTRAVVEAERERNAEKQRKWRDKHRPETDDSTVSNPVTPPVTTPVSNETPTRPDPTRPDLYKETPSLAKKQEARLPSDWVPTASHFERAKTGRIDITKEVEAFRLHAETHDRHAANWNAAFTTWLNRAKPSKAAPGITAANEWMYNR
jgi:hypothetical protein